jgi:hypothetical protein
MAQIGIHLDRARRATSPLRNSMDDLWPAVRDVLMGLDIDSRRPSIGELLEDRGILLIVATNDGRAVEVQVPIQRVCGGVFGRT